MGFNLGFKGLKKLVTVKYYKFAVHNPQSKNNTLKYNTIIIQPKQ